MAQYIYRIETGYTRGWQVRVPGKKSKLFSDGKCGSAEEALIEARAYRDSLTDRLPGPPASHLASAEVRRKRQEALSTTGIPGLSIFWAPSKSGEESFPYIQMTYIDEEGRPRARKRSLKLAGPRRAVREIAELMVTYRPDYDDVDRLYRRAIRVTNRMLRERDDR